MDKEEIIANLTQWADNQPLVRCAILTSSLAIPNAPFDVFSDYDVILVLSEVRPFHEDRTWLRDFGPVLVMYRDPLELQDGFLKSGNVTQYENGLKIDFTLWPVEMMKKIAADVHLPAEFDAGYRILLDKDHLTDALKPPTYRAYIPAPPAEAEYQEAIEVFFLEATYVAKYLWRDDLMAAKFILDNFMKQEHLRPMLEWRLEIHHQWSVKPGPYGRRIKKWLRSDLWTELENTYTGAGLDENWEALFKTIALMRKTATEVGDCLGFDYPHAMDRRTVAYLLKVKTQVH